jgi:hypothetical protein
MSDFNNLYRGDPLEAANRLEHACTEAQLRAALINALTRIAYLEHQVQQLRERGTP